MKFMYTIKNSRSILLALLIIISSCAKEIYTDEDAAYAKREAQKVGLTVMIRDVGSRTTDLSGFTVSASQWDDDIEGLTSADGIASLMVVKGDVVLQVKKEGYVPVTALLTTHAAENERNNTVTLIPVFSEAQAAGSLQGKVFVKTNASDGTPLADVPVSIDVDINDWIRLAFMGLGDNIDRYCPGALAYSSANLMQTVRTGANGDFQFVIPLTMAGLAYTVTVHETAGTPSTSRTVVTDGQNSSVVFFLTPDEK